MGPIGDTVARSEHVEIAGVDRRAGRVAAQCTVNVRGVPGVDGSAAVGMYIELVPMVGFMAPDPDYKVYSQTLTADGGLWKVQNPWDSPLEVEVQETVRCIGIYPFDTDAY